MLKPTILVSRELRSLLGADKFIDELKCYYDLKIIEEECTAYRTPDQKKPNFPVVAEIPRGLWNNRSNEIRFMNLLLPLAFASESLQTRNPNVDIGPQEHRYDDINLRIWSPDDPINTIKLAYIALRHEIQFMDGGSHFGRPVKLAYPCYQWHGNCTYQFAMKKFEALSPYPFFGIEYENGTQAVYRDGIFKSVEEFGGSIEWFDSFW